MFSRPVDQKLRLDVINVPGVYRWLSLFFFLLLLLLLSVRTCTQSAHGLRGPELKSLPSSLRSHLELQMCDKRFSAAVAGDATSLLLSLRVTFIRPAVHLHGAMVRLFGVMCAVDHRFCHLTFSCIFSPVLNNVFCSLSCVGLSKDTCSVSGLSV